MANYKLSSSSSKKQKNNSKKTPKIPLPKSYKKILLPSILLFLFHIFSPIFIFPEHLKLPIYNALKEK
jgi:hypothetical protein